MSIVEWNASLSIPALPDKAAATNLLSAIAVFAPSAHKVTERERGELRLVAISRSLSMIESKHRQRGIAPPTTGREPLPIEGIAFLTGSGQEVCPLSSAEIVDTLRCVRHQ
jgi:hypothetical protein